MEELRKAAQELLEAFAEKEILGMTQESAKRLSEAEQRYKELLNNPDLTPLARQRIESFLTGLLELYKTHQKGLVEDTARQIRRDSKLS